MYQNIKLNENVVNEAWYLRVAGEALHGEQQLVNCSGEQMGGHSLGQVLGAQAEDTRRRHQLHLQGGGLAPHPFQHQLEVRGPQTRYSFTLQCNQCKVSLRIFRRSSQESPTLPGGGLGAVC